MKTKLRSMKRIILLMSMVIYSSAIFAQTQYATRCGSGCYIVTATPRMSGVCGGQNDYVYTIQNKSREVLDISLYAEKTNGDWTDEGLEPDVASGREIKDAFWGCNLTGRYIIYYRPAGSIEKFPSGVEVKKSIR